MLRDYQKEMIDRLKKAWQRYRSVMVQMPTGTGKTHVMADVIGAESRNVLVVTHRKELIDQIAETFDAFDIAHGLIVSGRKADLTQRVQVASIQTLARREDAFWSVDGSDDRWRPDMVIIDEAHHALAKTYKRLWEQWPEARFLGLTATPCRLNGKGFTDLFDVLLQSWTIGTFIDKGWLSEFEYVSARPESLMVRQVAALRKRGADGDYQTKEMVTVMDCEESIAHLYDTYLAFADGKKGIVYAIDREHARHICDYYRQRGVSCCVIDSKTPAEVRRALVNDYVENRLQVMVNVDIFGEGWDVPEVEFIQLARPTLSLSKYLQQVGRGMRISQGKEAVLILDNVGLYQTFGLPTEERDWRMTFEGLEAGRGLQGMQRPVIIKEDGRKEKELMNLQMVRIYRNRGDQQGLAIYLQGGKYGVMKDGKVTCQPVFERISRLQEEDMPFYALATYPYALYRNRTTVIDMQGLDLMVQLYGAIERKGDFFCGSDSKGERLLWDSVGRKYYQRQEPQFVKIGGLDMVRTKNNLYELRYAKGMAAFQFSKDEVLYNKNITIIRDRLIVRNGGIHIYKIYGYLSDSVLVEAKRKCGSMQVLLDGKIGQYYDQPPSGLYFDIVPSMLKLRWAE
ncbi:MAG: DEAD/DEAH box helicase family protein [Bacteroidaceae bacterium]|nr:DEAD/DEAH box helicase family protein [Bacteroidaceae bacterium]